LALAALKEAGLIHSWIQQNHDGLPQKAGYPQEDIIEIHGSWYDPSNPVVCYDGALKPNLFSAMKQEADKADLVVVLGTSLSGLNSDQVAKNPARRSLQGKALGTVIVNLQQTLLDGESTLRLFAETDRVFEELLTSLKMSMDSCPIVQIPESRVLVPYTRTGKKSETIKTCLDLSKGQRIRLNMDHNCQGAKQPVYMHIGAKEPHVYRGQVRQPGPGEGHVVRYSPKQGGWELQVEGVSMLLGGWWVEAAMRGKVNTIPVVNVEQPSQGPKFQETANKLRVNSTGGPVRVVTNSLKSSVMPRAERMNSTVSSKSGISSSSSNSNISG